MTQDGSTTGTICSKCGAFGGMPHLWVEQDCILPHRQHSRATIGHLCEHCIDRHKEWLTEIVELYAHLCDVLEPGSIPDDTAEHGRPKKRPASPAPVRLDAWAMLNDTARLYRTGAGDDLPDVPGVLTVHAQTVFDDLGWTHTAPDTVSGCAAVLSGNADTIAASAWVDEYDADLRWVRQALRRTHGISNPKPLGQCLTVDCGGTVWPDRDDGRPKCDRCARRYGTLDIVRLHAHERSTA